MVSGTHQLFELWRIAMRRLWVQLVLRALVEGFQIGIVVWAALATLSVLGLRLSFAQ